MDIPDWDMNLIDFFLILFVHIFNMKYPFH